MLDICNKFATKIDMKINILYFLYNGNKINYELTFKQQANTMDNNHNQMNILVYQNQNDELKCKKCGKIIHLDIIDNIIKYNKEQKDTLMEMKNQIDNIINLNEINDIVRKIKVIKIILKDLITENEKNIKSLQNILNDCGIMKKNDFNFEITYNLFNPNETKTVENFLLNL